MPRIRKTYVQRILKPSHLQAIGLVAAAWSSLELSVLLTMSKVANISLTNTTILAGPSNVTAWMEMLRKLAKLTNYGDEGLKPITTEIGRLQTERNQIVHSCWLPDNPPPGLLNLFTTKPAELAKGVGIPKRGKQIFIEVQKTPKEMRSIAREIEAAEVRLHEWLRQQQPKPLASRLAQALLAPQSPPANLGMTGIALSTSEGLLK